MILVLAIAVCAAIALPHLLDLGRTPAVVAASLWGVALGLRAAAGLSVVLWVVLVVPTTEPFDALTAWCWDAVVPLLTAHLNVEGHALGGALAALPGMLLAASSASIAFGLVRAGRQVRSALAVSVIGRGPEQTVIVGGSDVVLAVAGFKRPQLVVSAGALVQLDDAELAAGLAHERGHIARCHRWVLVYAELCRGLGRFLPGTARAKRQLVFHLERDADAFAMRSHDRVALASAICKAAMSRAAPAPAYALLAGSPDITGRLDELLEGAAPRAGVSTALLRISVLAGVLLLLLLVVAVPLSVAGVTPSGQAVPTHCLG